MTGGASARGASARGWALLAAASVAYLAAVTQRTTLGVAGLAAADRFSVSAAALATLGVLQLVVYAALQIPVGVLVDRFGPRSVLIVGAVLMAAGQVVVAVAPTLAPAVAGRMLVGAGDACTFLPALRLLTTWFLPSRVPLVSQLFGNVGQLGQVLSAVPFVALLHVAGWTSAFLTAASLSVLALVVVLLLVREGGATRGATSLRGALVALAAAVRRPGTRLGFWSHFVTQSSGVVFGLLWGYPFLVSAIGLSAGAAGGLIGLQVVGGLAAGPLLGVATARHPLRRSNLVLTVVVAMAVVWTAVLLWPGRPPVAVLVLLVLVIGTGGPASQIGFDYARTTNPADSLGSANGFVNVGGFTASFSMMFLVGALLDAHRSVAGGALYSLDGFRWAFGVQYLVVGGGVVLLLIERRRTRAELRRAEGIAIPPLPVALGAVLKRRRARTAARNGPPIV